MHGSVVTISSNQEAVQICINRVNTHSPLKYIISWILINEVREAANVLQECQKQQLLFDSIIYCGETDRFPIELSALLQPKGTILAPVKIGLETRFQLFVKNGQAKILKTINGFGVAFQSVAEL